MQLKQEEEIEHDKAIECFICGQPLRAKRPLHDHDHLSGSTEEQNTHTRTLKPCIQVQKIQTTEPQKISIV